MDPAEMMTVHIDPRGSAVVVSVRGELDLVTVPVLRQRLGEVSQAPTVPLVIDLSEVSFMASPGLALLVDLHRRFIESGVMLVLVATGSSVLRSIQLTGLDQIFALHPTVDDAIGSTAAGR